MRVFSLLLQYLRFTFFGNMTQASYYLFRISQKKCVDTCLVIDLNQTIKNSTCSTSDAIISYFSIFVGHVFFRATDIPVLDFW